MFLSFKCLNFCFRNSDWNLIEARILETLTWVLSPFAKHPWIFCHSPCRVQMLFISNLRERRVLISELLFLLINSSARVWNLLLKMQGYTLSSDQIQRNFDKPSVSLAYLLACFLSSILWGFENILQHSWVKPCSSKDTKCYRLWWEHHHCSHQSVFVTAGWNSLFYEGHENFRHS